MIEVKVRLRAQSSAKEVQIGATRTFAAEGNPELERTQQEVEALKRELARIEGSSPIAAIGKGHAAGTAVIQVMDKAIEPDRKSKPRLALIALLSTLVAGFVAVLWAFVREAMDKAKADSQQASRLLDLDATLPGSRSEFLADRGILRNSRAMKGTEKKMNVQPVITCGGSGTRPWPLARAGCPKQFLVLAGNESLLSAGGAAPRPASHEKGN